jgi:phenylalanyl-tRNA synthetase beta chain
VRVPTWRASDVTREIDLVEEVARFVLDEVPFTLPARRESFGRLTRAQRVQRTIEDVLVGCGYSEVCPPSLVSAEPEPDAFVLPQPLSSELAALRTSLHPSLVAAVRHNLAVGNSGIALFEIARVYLRSDDELPIEQRHVGGIVEGGLADAKWALEQVYAALGIEPSFQRATEPFLHPARAARTDQGWVGELHPAVLEGAWGGFELDLDALVAAAPGEVEYAEVSPFPPLRQDLAFLVPEAVTAAELATAIREAGGEELHSVQVFDEYRSAELGAGRKSLAFALAFQSRERTLTDEDAAASRERIVEAVRRRLGGELRA